MGIFCTDHLKKLLHNKFVLLIGDSVQRSIYKDLVVLWHQNRFIKDSELRAKGEKSFLSDRLVERSELTNGVNYKEVREFKSDHILIRFYFATRVYNDYIESILKEYEGENAYVPDVVVLNSCLWDITRYGKKGWDQYQANIEKLCSRLDDIVPAETCIIWRTTLPVSQGAKGGFLSGDLARSKKALVVDVLLANYLAYAVVVRHKYDVIDMHFLFTEQQQRRAMDGVHWNMFAHRRMSNILLSHVSEAWGLGLPRHPVMDDDRFEFESEDLSMNTTDVLKCAYQPEIAVAKQSTFEERYGGPKRSQEEMFRYYNNFYNRPPRGGAEVRCHGQENYAPFYLEPRPYPPAEPFMPVQAFDAYWACDEPQISNAFCHQQGSSRRVELALYNGNNWNFDLKVPPSTRAHWTEAGHFRGKSKKVGKRKPRNFKPYKPRGGSK